VARNPGGYTDTFKYLLSLIPPQLPSGDAPDLREAAKALVDALDHDLFYDRQLAALRAALAASAPPPTGSSSRELADLDVERLRAAYHAEYTSGDNRCEHGVRWDCRDRAEETVHWDRLARAYAEQDATPEGEA
jgi:hypothetical protein